MKVRIAQKDIIGYVFLLVVAGACIAVGARVLHNQHITSGTFGVVLGVVLIIAAASMTIRKD